MEAPAPKPGELPRVRWFAGLLRDSVKTVIAAFVVALLSVFSNKLVDSVKFALNRADLRTAQYEKLATDLGDFAYSSELIDEYLRDGWTTKSLSRK